MAEIVWGDGAETHHKIIDLSATHQNGGHRFDWTLDEPTCMLVSTTTPTTSTVAWRPVASI